MPTTKEILAVLKPFAVTASFFNPSSRNDLAFADDYPLMPGLTVGDLRRAREVFRQLENGPDGLQDRKS